MIKGGPAMKNVRCSVDRIVSGIAVLISDENEIIELNAEDYALHTNDVVDLTIDGKEIKELVRIDSEREQRLKKNKSRLSSLFKNKGNK